MKNSEIRNSQTGYVFLLIFILLSIGIATGGYFAYRNYEKNFRTEIENQLSAVADLKVDQLVQWRRERLGDGQVFYKNDVFSDLIKRYFKNKSDEDVKKRIQAWMGQISTAYVYNRICLHDISGVERISFPEGKIHTPFIFSVRSAEVLKSGKVEFLDFYRDENDKRVYLTIFIPILDARENEKPLGIIALRIDPTEYLYPMVEKWPTLSKTSETLIIRREGNDALFLNELRFQKNSALNLRIPIGDTNTLAVKAVLGQKGIVEGRVYRGESVIGYVSAVPDSPWFLVARMDMKEMYASLRERLWLIVFLVSALLAGAGTGLGLIWRHQYNRFYREQYKSAEELHESELRLRRAVSNAPFPIMIHAEDGEVVMISNSWTEITGYTHAEIPTTAAWTEKAYGQRKQFVQEDIDRLYGLTEKIYEGNYEITAKLGNKRTWEFMSAPLGVLPDGRRMAISMAVDITERKRAEEALQESEAKFRQTFDVSPVGIVMVGLDKKFLRCNNSFSRSLGYLTEELIGKSIEDVTLPADRPIGMAEMKAIINGEMDTSHVQKRYIRKDGQVVWGEVTISLVRDSEKHPQYFLAIIQDITESKLAEERLRSSEAKYRHLFNNAVEGVYQTTPDGKLVSVNKAFVSMFGYESPEEMIATVTDIAHQLYVHPDDRKIPTGILREKGFLKDFEMKMRRKDGSEIWTSLNARLNTSPQGDIFFEGFISDITERKKAEESLLLKNIVFDFSIAANSVSDRNGIITEVNKAFLNTWGYPSKEEVIGKPILQFIQNENEAIAIRTSLNAYGKWEGEYTAKRKDDSTFIAYGMATDLKDSTGKLIGYQSAVSDITERKKVEEALKVSKERLLFATDGAHLGIWNWNTVTGELIWSNQCKALFGIPQNETMSYQRFSDALHPDDRARTDKAVNDALENHTDYDIEYRSLWPDGGIHWLAAKGRGFYDDTGKALRLEGIVLDITERKKTEEALQESERRLNEASKLAQLGHWVWEIKTGNVEWSDEVYNIFQLDRNEFTPQIDSILALSPWPEDHERDKELIRKAMETHEKGNYEQRFLRPDKSIGYYFSTFQGRYDDGGNLIFIVGTVQDITERKQAEEKLFMLALRQEAILSAVPDVIMEVNNDKIYTWANQAGIDFFGNDVIGKEASFYFEGEQETYKTVQPLFKGNENIIYLESWQRRKDGEKRLLAWWCRVLKDENGKVTGVLSSASDITERKQAEDEIIKLNAELEQRVVQRTTQLEATNKELEAFSYSVSHDLRAPLRHVSGYVDLLGKQFQTKLPEKGRHYLGEITDSVRQMGVLIDDLLNFSRSGRVEMHELILDMNQVVEEVSKQMSQDNSQRNIEWSIAHMPSLHCDKTMMHLVWENLLSNAVKFTRTRRKAKIEIGVREEGKEFVFFVRDNGVGFDMQYAQKLFGVFQRLHATEDFEGTGIGLANVRRIVLRHGGRTWAESELDKGATFYFSLPK